MLIFCELPEWMSSEAGVITKLPILKGSDFLPDDSFSALLDGLTVLVNENRIYPVPRDCFYKLI